MTDKDRKGIFPNSEEEALFSKELSEFLGRQGYQLSSDQNKAVIHFWRQLFRGNQEQNLTRLISPVDFLYGHLLDVIELEKSGLVESPVMDLGSGCGVPGLLSAVVFTGKKWILAESEKSKADFLSEVCEEFGLGPSEVEVIPTRAELFLKYREVKSVVSRAVGKIDRIFSWIGSCSTWNNLILLKGPGWAEEWNGSSVKKRFREIKEYKYRFQQEAESRDRIIVKLTKGSGR